jgi:hypothetical protein
MHRVAVVSIAVALSLLPGGCGALAEQAGVVTARTVAGPKIGVLQGVTVQSREDLGDREKRVLVDMSLLHEVSVEQTGDFEVVISSDLLPRIRATILGAGPVALDLEPIEVEFPADGSHVQSVEIDQLAFVEQEGEWVLVLQMSKVGLVPEDGSGVNAWQFVSYPSSTAQQMSREAAIVYVDTVLDLASRAQRL